MESRTKEQRPVGHGPPPLQLFFTSLLQSLEAKPVSVQIEVDNARPICKHSIDGRSFLGYHNYEEERQTITNSVSRWESTPLAPREASPRDVVPYNSDDDLDDNSSHSDDEITFTVPVSYDATKKLIEPPRELTSRGIPKRLTSRGIQRWSAEEESLSRSTDDSSKLLDDSSRGLPNQPQRRDSNSKILIDPSDLTQLESIVSMDKAVNSGCSPRRKQEKVIANLDITKPRRKHAFRRQLSACSA